MSMPKAMASLGQQGSMRDFPATAITGKVSTEGADIPYDMNERQWVPGCQTKLTDFYEPGHNNMVVEGGVTSPAMSVGTIANFMQNEVVQQIVDKPVGSPAGTIENFMHAPKSVVQQKPVADPIANQVPKSLPGKTVQQEVDMPANSPTGSVGTIARFMNGLPVYQQAPTTKVPAPTQPTTMNTPVVNTPIVSTPVVSTPVVNTATSVKVTSAAGTLNANGKRQREPSVAAPVQQTNNVPKAPTAVRPMVPSVRSFSGSVGKPLDGPVLDRSSIVDLWKDAEDEAAAKAPPPEKEDKGNPFRRPEALELQEHLFCYLNPNRPAPNMSNEWLHRLNDMMATRHIRLLKEANHPFHAQFFQYICRYHAPAIERKWLQTVFESKKLGMQANSSDQFISVTLEIDFGTMFAEYPKIAAMFASQCLQAFFLMRNMVYNLLVKCQAKYREKPTWKLQSEHQVRLVPYVCNAAFATRNLSDFSYGLSGGSGRLVCAMDVLIEKVHDPECMAWHQRGSCENCDGGLRIISSAFGRFDHDFTCPECAGNIYPSATLYEPAREIDVSLSLNGKWDTRRKMRLSLQGSGYAEPLHPLFREGNRVNVVVTPCSHFVNKNATEWYFLVISNPEPTFAPCPRPPVLLDLPKFPTHSPESPLDEYTVTPEHRWQLYGVASVISTMRPLPDIPRYFYLCMLLSASSVSYAKHTTLEQDVIGDRPLTLPAWAQNNDIENVGDGNESCAFTAYACSKFSKVSSGFSHTQFSSKEMEARPLHCFFTGPDDLIVRTMLDRGALFLAQPCFSSDGTGQKRICYSTSRTLLHDLQSTTCGIIIVDVMRLSRASSQILLQALATGNVPVLDANGKVSKFTVPISSTIWGYGMASKDNTPSHLIGLIGSFDIFLPLPEDHGVGQEDADERAAELCFQPDCFDVRNGPYARPTIVTSLSKVHTGARQDVNNVLRATMCLYNDEKGHHMRQGISKNFQDLDLDELIDTKTRTEIPIDVPPTFVPSKPRPPLPVTDVHYKGKKAHGQKASAVPPPILRAVFPTCTSASIGFKKVNISAKTAMILQEIASSLSRSTMGFNQQQIRSIRIHSVLLRLSASLAVLRSHLSYTTNLNYETEGDEGILNFCHNQSHQNLLFLLYK